MVLLELELPSGPGAYLNRQVVPAPFLYSTRPLTIRYRERKLRKMLIFRP